MCGNWCLCEVFRTCGDGGLALFAQPDHLKEGKKDTKNKNTVVASLLFCKHAFVIVLALPCRQTDNVMQSNGSNFNYNQLDNDSCGAQEQRQPRRHLRQPGA